MSRFVRVGDRRRVVAAMLLLTYLPACTSWQVGKPTPAQFVEREHPATIRITRSDSTILEMRDPAVRNDSLVGVVARPTPSDTQRVSIALADVQSVTAKQTDAPRTVFLVVVVGGLFVAGIVYLVQCSGAEGMAAIGCP